MGKYPKIATVLLAVCMLACLLAGCNELHSDSYEDIMNGIIVDSLYGETYVYNCLGNELSVSIEDGKVFIQSMGEYLPQGDFDAEAAEVYMCSGTYTQENGILTANIDEMRIRYLVSGKDKVAFQTAAIASAALEEFKNAAQIFSEKGMLLKDLYYNDPPYPVTATIKIDTTGENWRWISGEVYCEDSTLYECVYMADNGNYIHDDYSADGSLRWRTEWSTEGIQLSMTHYDEDGDENQKYVYYEDGSLKLVMYDGEISAFYEKDGTKIEQSSHHYYADGLCVFCGAEDPQLRYSEGLKFEYSANGYEYIVVGLGECTDTDIVIPATYNDCDVIGIGENAFLQCEKLTSVTIPETVIWIDKLAFAGCTNLSEVTLQTGCGEDGGLSWIENGAFKACTSLKSIVIPNSVGAIYDGAFMYCTNLRNITIGSGVQHIAGSTFIECPNLTSIQVVSGNTVYHSAENCIIETKSKMLVLGCQNSVIPTDGSVTRIDGFAFYACSNLKNLTIPNSVTEIDGFAFCDCSSLKNITISDNITSIDGGTFWGCTSLERVIIPGNVTTIGESAFQDCSSLIDITFKGTKAQWNAISKANGWDSNTGSYTINYTNGGNVASEGLTYTLNADNKSYSVTGIGTCKDTDVVIPTTYKGLPVTGIGEKAFDSCHNVMNITIPGSVTKIGNQAFEACVDLTNITIPNSVTSIGNDVFAWCVNLASITVENGNKVYHSTGNCLIETASKILIAGCKSCDIPADGSVIKIGDYAFHGRDELADITIPNTITSIGNGAFWNCYGLTSITIPSSVISIGNEAFCYCENLTSIVIPDSVTSIGEGAFSCCGNLKSIVIPDSVMSIGGAFDETAYYENPANWKNNALYIGKHLIKVKETLSGTYTIKADTKCIAGGAFSECSKLTSITIPDSVTSISGNAFQNCSSLTNITIPDGVVISYSDLMFYGCTSLKSVSLPDSMTSIGEFAFAYCDSLISIEIPKSVTSIGECAFASCSGLTDITYKGTKAQWNAINKEEDWDSHTGNYTIRCTDGNAENSNSLKLAFSLNADGKSYSVVGRGNCTAMDIGIPEIYNGLPVTGIGGYAFQRSQLTSITIPDSVTSIGQGAFSNCTELKKVTLGKGIDSIEHKVFFNCLKLTSITIPDGVTNIDESAFSLCIGLSGITIPSSVTRIGSGAFCGCSSLTDITYNGTKAEWHAIDKGGSWNIDTGDYTVHCTDGDIAKADS